MALPGRDGKVGSAVKQESGAFILSEPVYIAQSDPTAVDILMVSREHPGEATPRPLGSVPE
jgi:hypothetical protein